VEREGLSFRGLAQRDEFDVRPFEKPVVSEQVDEKPKAVDLEGVSLSKVEMQELTRINESLLHRISGGMIPVPREGFQRQSCLTRDEHGEGWRFSFKVSTREEKLG
jgi:hypothetical protein